ncbi:MAG TPA: helix-turn-helix domain-containing protein [Pyrinomonadaceae bacterium]|nr:helix-turn-helix domain-containing protein [Pyrinomonadaceae bacterium]
MRHRSYDVQFGCAVEAALEVIGGKWKAAILFRLLDGKKRFNEIKRLFPSLTQRILTQQLRELERDGVIERKVYAEIPPKVEYSLTEFGRTLETVLRLLSEWGKVHVDEIIENRERKRALTAAAQDTGA